jgi:hypothetical protein
MGNHLTYDQSHIYKNERTGKHIYFNNKHSLVIRLSVYQSHIEHRAKQYVKISLNENNYITHIAQDKFC